MKSKGIRIGFPKADTALAHSLSASDFSFADLKRPASPVYVVLPRGYLDVCDKYFRLILATAQSELVTNPRQATGAADADDDACRKGGLI